MNIFIAVFIHLFNLGWANSLDEDLQRLKAFREHQRFNAQFAQQRLAGRVAHDEMNEQWERQMEMARQDYIRQKKKAEMTEDGPEARADKVEKLAQQRAYEKIELEYLRQKRLTSQKNRRLVGLTEDEELGLLVNRPRFDRRRRVLYGATPRWKGQAGSGGGSRTSWSPSDSTSFPEPPMPGFGDSGDQPGYEPGFGEELPPPPPPPPPTSEIEFPPPPPEGYYPPPPPPPEFMEPPPEF